MSSSGDGKDGIPEWRSKLRASNNPYASHYYAPDEEQDAPLTARDQYRRSENPHAWHYYVDSEKAAASGPHPAETAPVAAPRPTIAKGEFESACRSIFRRYMPELEKGRVRPHHQEFIRRNSARSPEGRYAILEALCKYDLSSEPGLRTYFNREDDAFTEEKLLQIEKSVADE